MVVTTDPVELWASPNSRSRLEKDFFESKFGPFYRTAQVFIKPTNQENVIIMTSANWDLLQRLIYDDSFYQQIIY